MEDEKLDLELDTQEEKEKLEVKNRFQKLSEKVKLTAQEKEAAEAKAKEEAERATSLEKERDFYKEFASNSSKYPQAGEYQDKIWEKVKSGYSTEDAIVSTLAKEGKFDSSFQAPVIDNVAGGSSANQIVDKADKTLEEMSLEEKRNQLLESEKRGEWDLSNLRG